MASAQIDYWFRPGRGGGRNPGILAVQNKYEFSAHEVSNNGSIWTYNCKLQNVQPKQELQGLMGNGFFKVLTKFTVVNRAEHLRHQMKEIVRKIQLKQWVKLSEI